MSTERRREGFLVATPLLYGPRWVGPCERPGNWPEEAGWRLADDFRTAEWPTAEALIALGAR